MIHQRSLRAVDVVHSGLASCGRWMWCAAGLRNFENTYKPAVDAWADFDNVGAEPMLIQWGENQ